MFYALGATALGEVPAGTATALPAAVGTFTLTFQPVVNQFAMAADQGTYTLTGQSTNGNVSMAAAQGSYTLSGQAVVLNFGAVLTATPYLTGSVKQFGFSALGEVALGEAAQSQRPTFQISWQNVVAPLSMPAAQGTYTLTGFDANLVRGYVLTAEQGTYTIIGNTASFLISMPASQGSFVLSGPSPDLTRSTPKIRAFPRVGRGTVSAKSTGRDIKIRAYGG